MKIIKLMKLQYYLYFFSIKKSKPKSVCGSLIEYTVLRQESFLGIPMGKILTDPILILTSRENCHQLALTCELHKKIEDSI